MDNKLWNQFSVWFNSQNGFVPMQGDSRAEDLFAAWIDGRTSSSSPLTEEEAGMDSAWPLRDVLNTLIKWADHLRNSHDCDHDGYEVLLAAIDAAKPYTAASELKAARSGEERKS